MQSHTEPPQTLLSAIHPFTSPDLLSATSLHPFSSTAENAIADLRDLLQTTDTIAHTTNVLLNAPAINSKTVSLLRQHTAAQHGLHLVRSSFLLSPLLSPASSPQVRLPTSPQLD